MENVFFKPWVGKSYNQGYLGKQILVLGESHYCGHCKENNQCGDLSINDDACRNFTTNTIKSFLNYQKGEEAHCRWMNTNTKFTNVFHNEKVNVETMLQFWDSIIFYNYVQFGTDGPRISPKKSEFSESEKAFFEVLKEYKPDIVIVWGKRLWDKLPNSIANVDFHTLRNADEKFYFSDKAGKKIQVYVIYHPSIGYFNYGCHDYLKKALRLSECR